MAYVHPEIQPVTSRVLPVWLFRTWGILVMLPVVFASIGVLWCQRWLGLQASVGTLRIAFTVMTRYCHENQHVVVAMMFPGELIPWPVDIGMVDVVLALNAMGIATTNCCEGHSIAADKGNCAYVAIMDGLAFPTDVLSALDAAGVHYYLCGGPQGSPALYALTLADNESFRFALQTWALDVGC